MYKREFKNLTKLFDMFTCNEQGSGPYLPSVIQQFLEFVL